MDRVSVFSAVLSKSSIPLRALALAVACVSAPALAGSEPSTKVVECGEESCLLVSGYRADPAAIVSINGQTVAVEGRNGWRVRVPVDTVREWSAPHARTIDVSLRDPRTQAETVASVDLPIGLLGHITDLAALEITVR